jgi:hypothetical protein
MNSYTVVVFFGIVAVFLNICPAVHVKWGGGGIKAQHKGNLFKGFTDPIPDKIEFEVKSFYSCLIEL